MCAEPRREFYRHIDAVNVDLKAFTGDFYRRVCLARLQPVQETLPRPQPVFLGLPDAPA